MKVTLVVDGESKALEVDLDAGTARIGDRTFPFQIVAKGPNKVELEVDGEKVVVDQWPSVLPSPSDAVVVNGERFDVSAEATRAGPAGPPRAAQGARAAAPGSSPTAPTPPSASPSSGTGGTPVVPPMPGKVVELRVAEGDRVTRGQVLLVLEAMKMRNEIASPADGRVADVRVKAGSNVRAREPMLVIAPP